MAFQLQAGHEGTPSIVLPTPHPGQSAVSFAINSKATITFESSESSIGGGGYICDRSYRLHITGTDKNGEYIPAQPVQSGGLPDSGGFAVPTDIKITDEKLIRRMFDLVPVGSAPELYTRAGFSGFYKIVREDDNSLSLAYSGGSHIKGGTTLPPQTFVCGSWNLGRITAFSEAAPQQSPPTVVAPAWTSAANQIAAAVTAPDNGIPGTSGQSGFAAIFYVVGGLSSFHGHHPAGNPDKVIPYPSISPPLKDFLEPWCRKDTKPGTGTIGRQRLAGCAAVSVQNGNLPVYIFPTESSGDGSGVLILEGRSDSLPSPVLRAYEEAARLGGGECLLTRRWMLLERESGLHAMVRSNGQVIFNLKDGSCEMFDPLQAICLTATLTKSEAAKGTANFSTLKTACGAASGYRFRKVRHADGFWQNVGDVGDTLIPEKQEPSPPVLQQALPSRAATAKAILPAKKSS